MVSWKQNTIEEIVDSESKMIFQWEKLYGAYFHNAWKLNSLLNNFLKSVDKPQNFLFIAFLSQIKKHHTLALFSALRQHHIQTGMMLRQVIEATSWAIYALWNTDEDLFFAKRPSWAIFVPDKLDVQKNKWLAVNFPEKTIEFKKIKTLINDSVAHCDIVYTFQNFDPSSIAKWEFYTPFFDITDEYKVKSDLWFVANVIIGVLDLFYGANLKYWVFQFVDDFLLVFQSLVKENNDLKTEMMKHPRFIKVTEL